MGKVHRECIEPWCEFFEAGNLNIIKLFIKNHKKKSPSWITTITFMAWCIEILRTYRIPANQTRSSLTTWWIMRIKSWIRKCEYIGVPQLMQDKVESWCPNRQKNISTLLLLLPCLLQGIRWTSVTIRTTTATRQASATWWAWSINIIRALRHCRPRRPSRPSRRSHRQPLRALHHHSSNSRLSTTLAARHHITITINSSSSSLNISRQIQWWIPLTTVSNTVIICPIACMATVKMIRITLLHTNISSCRTLASLTMKAKSWCRWTRRLLNTINSKSSLAKMTRKRITAISILTWWLKRAAWRWRVR